MAPAAYMKSRISGVNNLNIIPKRELKNTLFSCYLPESTFGYTSVVPRSSLL